MAVKVKAPSWPYGRRSVSKTKTASDKTNAITRGGRGLRRF